jgi:hypothetical protein
MNKNRKIALIVGACFLISNFTFILGAFAFTEPILSASDYLTLASAKRSQMVLGALLEIMNGVAYIGIAVLIFHVMRERFESMALWYVAFRITEFVMQIISDISALSLVNVSEAYVKAGAAEISPFQAAGTVLHAVRFWSFQMVSVTLVLGALVLYTMLYKTKLVPRFLSIWGLIGAAAVLINAIFDWFGITIPNLGVLMLLNELTLGVWLIVKGFNTSEPI